MGTRKALLVLDDALPKEKKKKKQQKTTVLLALEFRVLLTGRVHKMPFLAVSGKRLSIFYYFFFFNEVIL